MGVTGGKELF